MTVVSQGVCAAQAILGLQAEAQAQGAVEAAGAGSPAHVICDTDCFYGLLFTVLSFGQVGSGLRGDSQCEPETSSLPL